MNRERRFGRLGRSLYKALGDATALSKSRQHEYVELEHWFWVLWQTETSDLRQLAQRLQVRETAVGQRLEAAMVRLPRAAGGLKDLSGNLESMVAAALGWSQLAAVGSHVRSGHLLLAALEIGTLRSWLHTVMPELQDTSLEKLAETYDTWATDWPESRDIPLDGRIHADGHALPDSGPAEESGLARWAVSLSLQAERDELDPVVGRDDELRQVIDILLRRRQNNPLLVGEAGVGKTAIAEGLAQRIRQGQVAPALRHAQVWSLDLGRLQAGASARGEFEQRLRSVLDDVTRSEHPIILFCDEVHTLIGAGGTAGTSDAANLVKPMLARGQLRMLAATTWSEYKQHIEGDAALTRRFQTVSVDEPTDAGALAMLRVIAPRFAQHHGIHITDGALTAAVRLSRRHLPGRQLPDKAISLLDTACARVAMSLNSPPEALERLGQELLQVTQAIEWSQHDQRLGLATESGRPLENDRHELLQRRKSLEQAIETQRVEVRALLDDLQRRATVDAQNGAHAPVYQRLKDSAQTVWVSPWVDERVVAGILSEWTGVPAGQLAMDDAQRLLHLQTDLQRRIHGQDDALAQMAQALQLTRSGLGDPGRPLGVFLLAGPTGTGKTETALALAEALFGGERHVVQFNMNEFKEAHSVSTLKGAPPGYVGYGKGGRLTEAIRRRPYSVLLLDEFDQAHRDVHEVFYQVFDRGWMEDGEGRRVSFRDCLILLTTNVGAQAIEAACEQDVSISSHRLNGIAHQALQQHFAPALLARTHVVSYRPLGLPALQRVADDALAHVGQRLASQGIALRLAGNVRDWIAGRAQKHPSRGRAARDILRQMATPVIAHGVLEARSTGRTLSEVRLCGGEHLDVDFVYADGPVDVGTPHPTPLDPLPIDLIEPTAPLTPEGTQPCA